MTTFYITFGQDHLFRDGWIEIKAKSEQQARMKTFDTFGDKWSSIYTKKNFKPGFFPMGCIAKF